MRSQELKEVGVILKELKESTTFAMSRGGRELFHTNFLAYILDLNQSTLSELKSNYVKTVKKNIIKSLFSEDSITHDVITFREKSNLDLVVIPNIKDLLDRNNEGFEVVVIEAKLKAIPTDEQLENYNEKLSKGIVFDLDDADVMEIERLNSKKQPTKTKYKISKLEVKLDAPYSSNGYLQLKDDNYKRNEKAKTIKVKIKRYLLAPASTFSEINDDLNWNLLNWSEFLQNVIPDNELTTDNHLISSLVADYKKSTANILELSEYAVNQTRTFISGSINSTDFFKFSINRSDFKNIRLHDLVGKVSYHHLRLSLHADIKKDTRLDLNKLPSGFELDSYIFYSRSIPGLGIQFKCRLDDKISVRIGVQLQGNQFRHFIEREGLDDCLPELSECAKLVDEWMRSGGASLDAAYGVFNEKRFLHLTTILTGNIGYDELKTMIIHSLNGALGQIQCKNEIGFAHKLKGVSKN